MKSTLLKKLAFTLMVGGVLAYVGHADHQAAIESHRIYCEQVGSGAWPDYQGIYEEACEQ